jgi:hypothetical protein
MSYRGGEGTFSGRHPISVPMAIRARSKEGLVTYLL